MVTGSDGRSRPRAVTDARIRAAVLDLVREVGPAGVTMEAVSASSGVARTTLYRRYSDRFDLLSSIAAEVAPLGAPVDARHTLDGFAELVGSVQRALDQHVGLRSLGEVLGGNDEFAKEWREKLVEPRLRTLRDWFDAGMREGRLRADLDVELIVELVLGGALAAAALRQDLPPGWSREVAETLWPVIRAE